MSTSASYSTLADRAAFGGSAALRNVTLALAGSLALWLSAKLQVPFYPVPITMQTFVVLIIGTAFGWRLGAATVALYLAQGALGLRRAFAAGLEVRWWAWRHEVLTLADRVGFRAVSSEG